MTLRYSQQSVDECDIAAVVAVLRSDYLTTGPEVPAFEAELAAYLGAKHVVCVSSGTAALHLALIAVQRWSSWPTSVVRVPALTFVATANAVTLSGRAVRVVDVHPETLLAPGADLTVDLFGQPARDGGGVIDAAHSLGANRDWSLGTYTLSFHPVKAITTAEGGAVVTDSEDIARRVRRLRDHGRENGECVEPGFNYRMSDLQAALGRSQLRRIDEFVARRRTLARLYIERLAPLTERGLLTLPRIDVERSAWHLFPVLFVSSEMRDTTKRHLAQWDIETQVHYKPVHLQPWYWRYGAGPFPVADDVWPRILSLPLHPGMSDGDVEIVVEALEEKQ